MESKKKKTKPQKRLMEIKRGKQELEMQVSQVKINKSLVEVEANKVDNLESKFTTLRGELKEEHQGHPHT
jgi:hypothetical protein